MKKTSKSHDFEKWWKIVSWLSGAKVMTLMNSPEDVSWKSHEREKKEDHYHIESDVVLLLSTSANIKKTITLQHQALKVIQSLPCYLLLVTLQCLSHE